MFDRDDDNHTEAQLDFYANNKDEEQKIEDVGEVEDLQF